jgi:hypothetical protein
MNRRVGALIGPIDQTHGGKMTTNKVATLQGTSRRSRVTSGKTRIVVESVIRPTRRRLLDAAMYQAMRRALLKVLPARSPGPTLAQVSHAVRAHLPADLYPGGAKAGWWLKTVQLDLEAKKIIAREKTKPLRLHRT